MDPSAVVAQLTAITPRGATSDGERRAAVWLRDALRERGRDASLQTIWVRPRWELALALGAALALAGSLLSIWRAPIGLALLAAATLALVGELSGRGRALRRLWPARATQNVVCRSPGRDAAAVRLIVTANIDAGRAGSIYADRWTGLEGRMRSVARGHLSSPPAWIAAIAVALTALAAARTAGATGGVLAPAQFALSLALVVAIAALADIALSEPAAGANANASGVAVALALAEALDHATLTRLVPELVLTGAGESGALGVAEHVRQTRRETRPEQVVVLAIEACGGGAPYWLDRDGRLLGLRFHPRLRDLMTAVADDERHLRARALRSHSISGAVPARVAGWPAIAVGCADELGRAPRARQRDDVAALVDPRALDATLEFCLAFAGRLDRELAAAPALAAA